MTRPGTVENYVVFAVRDLSNVLYIDYRCNNDCVTLCTSTDPRQLSLLSPGMPQIVQLSLWAMMKASVTMKARPQRVTPMTQSRILSLDMKYKISFRLQKTRLATCCAYLSLYISLFQRTVMQDWLLWIQSMTNTIRTIYGRDILVFASRHG